MSEKFPRLTVTLQPAICVTSMYICHSCGGTHELSRWQEHDDRDQPEYKMTILCKRCSDRLIEKHPRLYRQLDKYEPWPGGMALCQDCKWREGVYCKNKRAQVNGGPGLQMKYPPPAQAFCRPGGRRTIYLGPVTECDGKEIAEKPKDA